MIDNNIFFILPKTYHNSIVALETNTKIKEFPLVKLSTFSVDVSRSSCVLGTTLTSRNTMAKTEPLPSWSLYSGWAVKPYEKYYCVRE